MASFQIVSYTSQIFMNLLRDERRAPKITILGYNRNCGRVVRVQCKWPVGLSLVSHRCLEAVYLSQTATINFRLRHDLPFASHAGEKRLHDFIRHGFHRLHSENTVYATVSDCHSCSRNKTGIKQKRSLLLFPSTCALEFIARKSPVRQTRKWTSISLYCW